MSDVNGNWVSCLEAMTDHVDGGESRQFGSVTAASVGVPIPLFNQVFILEPPERRQLHDAAGWMAGHEVPFWVTVPQHLVNAIRQSAETIGLALREGGMPGMALPALPDPDVIGGHTPGRIVPVTDAEQLGDVAMVASDAFGAPLDAARVLTPASMLADDRMRWFVAYVDDEPAACGQLFVTGDVAGVYAIAVREGSRRQGLGEAITWQVLRAGAEEGCLVGVLQASPMGRSVYRRMGFEEVVSYRQFVPTA